MPDFPYGETVTLLHREVVDEDVDGNDVYGDVPTPIENVPVWPRDGNGNEQTQGQDMVTVGLAAVLPPGTDPTAYDAVVVYGDRYEITGDPAPYKSPITGTDLGVLISLTKVTG